jgi:cytochrome c oxidase cbb3-type subunit IV
MLKYIKNYAASINGIDIYPMISLMIFFFFFVGVLYYVKKMDKGFISDMNHLPLEGGEVANQNVPN